MLTLLTLLNSAYLQMYTGQSIPCIPLIFTVLDASSISVMICLMASKQGIIVIQGFIDLEG